MSNMLAMMLGGASGAGGLPPLGDLLNFDCAYCVAQNEWRDRHAKTNGHTMTAADVLPVRQAVTMVAGTLVCDGHTLDALPNPASVAK